jgi:hypothetical protein
MDQLKEKIVALVESFHAVPARPSKVDICAHCFGLDII